jgi:hypothetical protein
MNTAEDYVTMYRDWERIGYSQRVYTALCDLYTSLSSEERVRAAHLLINKPKEP